MKVALYKKLGAVSLAIMLLISNFYVTVLAETEELFPKTFDNEKSVEDFFDVHKGELQISDAALSENIGMLKLAYCGKMIKDENEFWTVYGDCENKAQQYVLTLLNNSGSSEEFNNNIEKYKDILNLDLDKYNNLSDKSYFAELLRNSSFSAEEFKKNFDKAVDGYIDSITVKKTNASDACMIDCNNGTYNNHTDYSVAQMALITKYNLEGISLSGLKEAKLKLRCSWNSTGSDNVNLFFYKMDANNWNGETLTYNEYVSIGNNPWAGKGYKWVMSIYSPAGAYMEYDVTEYLKEGMKEISFMTCVNSNAYKFDNPMSAANPAYLELSIDSSQDEQSPERFRKLNYSVESGSENVSVNTDKITINSAYEFDEQNSDIEVIKDGAAVDKEKYAAETKGNTITISFNGPLEENSVYSVVPAETFRFKNDETRYMLNSLSFKTESKNLTMSDIKFITNGNINDRLDLCKGEKAKSVVSVDNKCGFVQKCIVLVSLFEQRDGYVRMIASDLLSCDLSQNDIINLANDFDIPDDDGNYFITYNIWDNLSEMNKILYKKK